MKLNLFRSKTSVSSAKGWRDCNARDGWI